MRDRVIRIERQGTAVTFRRIRPPARRPQGVAQVQMGGREIRRNSKRAFDQLDGAPMSPAFVRKDAEKGKSIDMIRVFLQHLAAKRIGPVTSPALVMCDGGLKVPRGVCLPPGGSLVTHSRCGAYSTLRRIITP